MLLNISDHIARNQLLSGRCDFGEGHSTNASVRLWPKADTLAVLQIEIAGAQCITQRPTARGKSLPISLPKMLPTTPK